MSRVAVYRGSGTQYCLWRKYMPFCPNCKYEYRGDVAKCPDCDVDLVAELPIDVETESYSEEEFVPVFSAGDNSEAEVVKGVLLDAGIPVIEQADTGFWPVPTIMGVPGEEILTVPTSRLEEAQKVIEEALK